MDIIIKKKDVKLVKCDYCKEHYFIPNESHLSRIGNHETCVLCHTKIISLKNNFVKRREVRMNKRKYNFHFNSFQLFQAYIKAGYELVGDCLTFELSNEGLKLIASDPSRITVLIIPLKLKELTDYKHLPHKIINLSDEGINVILKEKVIHDYPFDLILKGNDISIKTNSYNMRLPKCLTQTEIINYQSVSNNLIYRHAITFKPELIMNLINKINSCSKQLRTKIDLEKKKLFLNDKKDNLITEFFITEKTPGNFIKHTEKEIDPHFSEYPCSFIEPLLTILSPHCELIQFHFLTHETPLKIEFNTWSGDNILYFVAPIVNDDFEEDD